MKGFGGFKNSPLTKITGADVGKALFAGFTQGLDNVYGTGKVKEGSGKKKKKDKKVCKDDDGNVIGCGSSNVATETPDSSSDDSKETETE